MKYNYGRSFGIFMLGIVGTVTLFGTVFALCLGIHTIMVAMHLAK